MPSEGRFPRLSALASRVEVVAATGSTNADLVAAAAAAPGALPHLSVLLTRDQTGGRGRLDRTWVAGPGRALAVSLLVRVDAIPVASRGWIPLVAGAAMTEAVAAQLPQHDVRMKWPNDVLVEGRKICGILAEVVPGDRDAVVIGSGVNTAMPAAELPVPTATSFAALGAAFDEDALLAGYVEGLDRALCALAAGDRSADVVRAAVQALCGTIGRDVRVSLPDGSTVVGRAVRLDDDGRLVVDADAGERALSAGDVVHVR
jgi:BirA family biotin operon repressor/biotin-[acetyl-CoA-carboxylase] ligase